jgi:hypothetical protein
MKADLPDKHMDLLCVIYLCKEHADQLKEYEVSRRLAVESFPFRVPCMVSECNNTAEYATSIALRLQDTFMHLIFFGKDKDDTIIFTIKMR